jgi:serpin B
MDTSEQGKRAALDQAVAKAERVFSLALYSRLREEPGNFCFSPFSVFAALAMTSGGARAETAAQMSTVLFQKGTVAPELQPAIGRLLRQVTSAGDDGPVLRVANAIWYRLGLRMRAGFLDLQREHYGTEPHAADFAGALDETCRAINAWVAGITEGRIRDLVRARRHVTEETLVVLVNALHFKDRWSSEFDPGGTQPMDFFLAPGTAVQVPTMRKESESTKFLYADAGEFKLMHLPYQCGMLAMLLVLPAAADGLAAIEARMDENLLIGSIRKMRHRNVRIRLPRFRIENGVELRPVLSAMGMPLAFTPAADFAGITEDAPVMIGEVVHKAFVATDEVGTEAAAATAVVSTIGSAFDFDEPDWVEFRADRPFLFFIVDLRAYSVLFMGRVADPRNPAAQ